MTIFQYWAIGGGLADQRRRQAVAFVAGVRAGDFRGDGPLRRRRHGPVLHLLGRPAAGTSSRRVGDLRVTDDRFALVLGAMAPDRIARAVEALLTPFHPVTIEERPLLEGG